MVWYATLPYGWIARLAEWLGLTLLRMITGYDLKRGLIDLIHCFKLDTIFALTTLLCKALAGTGSWLLRCGLAGK